MESGWLINFKDGTRICVNEKTYKSLCSDKTQIQSEEHWFNIEEMIKSNPDTKVIRGSKERPSLIEAAQGLAEAAGIDFNSLSCYILVIIGWELGKLIF